MYVYTLNMVAAICFLHDWRAGVWGRWLGGAGGALQSKLLRAAGAGAGLELNWFDVGVIVSCDSAKLLTA